ncbi:thiol reductant ABC exporter subunit CydD [Bartonella sp. W8097]|uniref:thiol reductant ABC exporter subunit CydD n=1 Tax=Bartonella apihabitans TaxID=2750929 RepID=UPI0018DC770B|nr:thiol reductant ABC exporter subunit CydD [Bartonella apihabitans]MBI0021619.1 thiol reductant ABC exporter subunit CydD [Bartonella apihabitans]
MENERAGLLPRLTLSQIIFSLLPLFWIAEAALLSLIVAKADEALSTIIIAGLAIIILAAIKACLDYHSQLDLFKNSRANLNEWRKRGLTHLNFLSPLSKKRMPSGEAANILVDQGETLVSWNAKYFPLMLRAAVVPLVILCLILPFSWLACLLLFITAPIIPLFWAIIGAKAQKAAKEQWQEMGEMNGYLLDRLRGIKTLRILDATFWSAKRLARQSDDLITRTMKVLRIAFLSSAVLELFSALGVALMAVYIGFHLLGVITIGFWGNKLSLAEGLFILLLAPSFFEPLRELASVWHDRVAGKAAMENFTKLVGKGETIVHQPSDVRQSPIVQQSYDTKPKEIDSPKNGAAIEIENLSFGFIPEKPVFKNFSLKIGTQEKVALTGKSGAGKSVLLALIAGLIQPDKGSIKVNGLTVDGNNIDEIRAKIGWMGAKPYWFDQSILSNITFNRKFDHIDDYLDLANLHDFANERKYQRLGEGGTGVSGGEAARLSLVRLALEKDRNVLLIDEPTAHLDPESAKIVIDALVKISGENSLLVATHDPELFKRMDRVIELSPDVNLRESER